MTAPRALLLLVALLVGALAVAVTQRHYDARDRERALLKVQTRRFGPTTRAHLKGYFAATEPGRALVWSAEKPGVFAGTVEVTLRLEGDPRAWRFRVDGDTVVPANEETHALAERVRQWAEK